MLFEYRFVAGPPPVVGYTEKSLCVSRPMAHASSMVTPKLRSNNFRSLNSAPRLVNFPMSTFLRISFILFDVLAMVGDNHKGVLICSSVYVTSHDSLFLKGLGVLVESRIIICVII